MGAEGEGTVHASNEVTVIGARSEAATTTLLATRWSLGKIQGTGGGRHASSGVTFAGACSSSHAATRVLETEGPKAASHKRHCYGGSGRSSCHCYYNR